MLVHWLSGDERTAHQRTAESADRAEMHVSGWRDQSWDKCSDNEMPPVRRVAVARLRTDADRSLSVDAVSSIPHTPWLTTCRPSNHVLSTSRDVAHHQHRPAHIDDTAATPASAATSTPDPTSPAPALLSPSSPHPQ